MRRKVESFNQRGFLPEYYDFRNQLSTQPAYAIRDRENNAWPLQVSHEVSYESLSPINFKDSPIKSGTTSHSELSLTPERYTRANLDRNQIVNSKTKDESIMGRKTSTYVAEDFSKESETFKISQNKISPSKIFSPEQTHKKESPKMDLRHSMTPKNSDRRFRSAESSPSFDSIAYPFYKSAFSKPASAPHIKTLKEIYVLNDFGKGISEEGNEKMLKNLENVSPQRILEDLSAEAKNNLENKFATRVISCIEILKESTPENEDVLKKVIRKNNISHLSIEDLLFFTWLAKMEVYKSSLNFIAGEVERIIKTDKDISETKSFGMVVLQYMHKKLEEIQNSVIENPKNSFESSNPIRKLLLTPLDVSGLNSFENTAESSQHIKESRTPRKSPMFKDSYSWLVSFSPTLKERLSKYINSIGNQHASSKTNSLCNHENSFSFHKTEKLKSIYPTNNFVHGKLERDKSVSIPLPEPSSEGLWSSELFENGIMGLPNKMDQKSKKSLYFTFFNLKIFYVMNNVIQNKIEANLYKFPFDQEIFNNLNSMTPEKLLEELKKSSNERENNKLALRVVDCITKLRTIPVQSEKGLENIIEIYRIPPTIEGLLFFSWLAKIEKYQFCLHFISKMVREQCKIIKKNSTLKLNEFAQVVSEFIKSQKEEQKLKESKIKNKDIKIPDLFFHHNNVIDSKVLHKTPQIETTRVHKKKKENLFSSENELPNITKNKKDMNKKHKNISYNYNILKTWIYESFSKTDSEEEKTLNIVRTLDDLQQTSYKHIKNKLVTLANLRDESAIYLLKFLKIPPKPSDFLTWFIKISNTVPNDSGNSMLFFTVYFLKYSIENKAYGEVVWYIYSTLKNIFLKKNEDSQYWSFSRNVAIISYIESFLHSTF
ncbi:hypothetical protein BY996DRAFT_6780310, partial [Phakopsora pachyrhizi]